MCCMEELSFIPLTMSEFVQSDLPKWAWLLIFSATCITFCWRYWKFTRAYAEFPSFRLDSELVLKTLTGKFRKKAPFTSVVFQEMVSCCKRFEKEGFCLMWFFRPYLVVFNAEFCKRLFNEPAITDKGTVYQLAEGVCGNGLLTSNEDTWKAHRKYLNPVFYPGVLKGKMHIFNSNAAEWVKKLEAVVGKPTTEMMEFSKYYSFTILAESILGVKLSDEMFGHKVLGYLEAVQEVSQNFIHRGTQPWLYWKFMQPFFPAGRKFLKLCETFRNFTQEVLLEMKKSVREESAYKEDIDCKVELKNSFARILLEQHLKDPAFTIEDVQDEISTMMIAGHDTACYGLMWCFYTLGRHPEIQEKVFKEIEAIKERDVTFDDLSELKYLECVIKETLRLYSAVPLYCRKLKKEIQCGKYTVPKGTEICFFLFMLHRNPDIYPDPKKFDPDRFLENNNIRPWMHMPFAEGYRSCIGKKFAMMEFKVVLVHILRRFEIRSLDKIEDADLDWTIMLKTINPIRMLFTLRQSAS